MPSDAHKQPPPATQTGGPGRSRMGRALPWLLLAIAVALVLVEPLVKDGGGSGLKGVWGIYAICGVAACLALVLVARILRPIVTRSEDYYDR